MKPWQLILNFLTKTLLWQPFTSQMEILNFSLFQSINNLSTDVMFVRDFNLKLESFGCAHKKPLVLCSKIYKNNSRADMDLIASHRNQRRMLKIEFCRHYFIKLGTSVNAFLIILILS